jgi:hypothetical protein
MIGKTTNLKLDGFSIEVQEGPATLLMQTDKGAFSVEMSEDQLSQLAYALRFVLYAQEPLRKKSREDSRSVRRFSLQQSGVRKGKGKMNRCSQMSACRSWHCWRGTHVWLATDTA